MTSLIQFWMFKFVLPGRPPAKSNSYRIIRVGSFSRLAPTAEVKAYEERVVQISEKQVNLLGGVKPFIDAPNEVELFLTWHRADKRRKDIDNIAKAIKDGMTKGGIWKDDSQVTSLHIRSVNDALTVETEWVDVIVCQIPSTSSSSQKVSKKKTKKKESVILNVQDVPLI